MNGNDYKHNLKLNKFFLKFKWIKFVHLFSFLDPVFSLLGIATRWIIWLVQWIEIKIWKAEFLTKIVQENKVCSINENTEYYIVVNFALNTRKTKINSPNLIFLINRVIYIVVIHGKNKNWILLNFFFNGSKKATKAHRDDISR